MIHVSKLTKRYGPRTAIHDLNFEVHKGEIVGFLGPNGAGKSTTMKILTGFMPASEGTAVVNGFDVFDNPFEVKRSIGFLPETPPVYPEMRVSDYLEFTARLHQVPSDQIGKQVSQAVEKTGLGDVRNRLIANLSKGYRQRVGLAQAILHNPKVLILDEPTVGLDPKQIIEIRGLIKSLAGDHTVILSSHILPEVTATCQRILIISKGKIVAEDTIDRLTSRLQKGNSYTMAVKNPAAGGLDAIRKLPSVSSVTTEGSKVLIQVTPNAAEIRDRIIETAVIQKMGVLEFSSDKMSLEDIFLQLTTVDPTDRGGDKSSDKANKNANEYGGNKS